MWRNEAKELAYASFHLAMLGLGVRMWRPTLARNLEGMDIKQPLLVMLLQAAARGTGSPGRIQATEIGCLSGHASVGMLQGMPSVHLTLVDPYESTGVDVECTPKSNAAREDPMGTMLENVKPFLDRVRFLREFSFPAASQVADESMDLVFIDGNHTYLAVREDIQAWLPKVKPGGLLIGHDWNHWHPGVSRAVLEAIPPYLLWLEPRMHFWIYQVPGGRDAGLAENSGLCR
ncbi:unnamed protein product [Polarella glacialis]|uniref:Class I SAM-dependent methyltransferase n=1 Tax=Polarella glacialis TaxID=89957 RepID=A0A813EDL3_POLGL|nr:unnamed protein product [Polarella glacialis]